MMTVVDPNRHGAHYGACSRQCSDLLVQHITETYGAPVWERYIRKHSSCGYCAHCGGLIPASSPCRLHAGGECPPFDVTAKLSYIHAAVVAARADKPIPWTALEMLATTDDLHPLAVAEQVRLLID